MELTDDIVLNLSKRITDERDLKTLGNCLGLTYHEIVQGRITKTSQWPLIKCCRNGTERTKIHLKLGIN